MGSQRVGHDWATELNWTDIGQNILFHILNDLSGIQYYWFFLCKKPLRKKKSNERKETSMNTMAAKEIFFSHSATV